MSPDNDESRHVIIGQVNGLYGVRGGLKVFSYTKPRQQIFAYKPWLLKMNATWVERNITSSKGTGKGLAVFLEGIEDREDAISLIGVDIAVNREQLPALPEGEFYWCDLIHLNVIDTDGKSLGKIINMQETGANDVMVVQGVHKILIPWVLGEVVKGVDLKAGQIYVDWLPEYQ